MKTKPVRVCDVSRVLRISSASLISFLKEKGFSVIGDFRSPLSSKMVELIQNGYNEGPPFQELNPFMPQAEQWEQLNQDTLARLHTPPPQPARSETLEEEVSVRKTRTRKPKLKVSLYRTKVYTGRIDLTPIDLELIHQILELDESNKIKVRDFLRRKTILKALSHLE